MPIYYHDGFVVPTLPPKDPDSDEWFGLDYSLLDAENIASSSWLIDDVPVSVDGDEVNGLTFRGALAEAKRTRIRLSGGILGREYRITNRCSTNLTPQDDKSFLFLVQNQ